MKDFGIDFEKFLAQRPFLFGQTQGCSHRPERPSATSPGQRPGLYDARGSPPCKGKSFCTYSANNPTATQKPRAMPWAISCCPFGASLGVRCCSGRRPPPAPPKEGSNRVCPYGWVFRYHPQPLLPEGGDHAGCSLLFGQTQGSAPTLDVSSYRLSRLSCMSFLNPVCPVCPTKKNDITHAMSCTSYVMKKKPECIYRMNSSSRYFGSGQRLSSMMSSSLSI